MTGLTEMYNTHEEGLQPLLTMQQAIETLIRTLESRHSCHLQMASNRGLSLVLTARSRIEQILVSCHMIVI